MLDFSNKVYNKILNLAIKHNFVSHCREYPFFTLEQQLLPAPIIRNQLRKNFKNPNFPYGLYIHFPFCKTRCSFCKYYTEVGISSDFIDEYLNALQQEVQLYDILFSNSILSNIYLGGGTPTLLSEKQIERLQNIIYQFFRFNKKTQISLEGTPESIKRDTLKKWHVLGVNRISVGCQSFNDDILKRVGRRHSVKGILKAFNIIREIGIKYTGIDLIFGLPGETLISYQKTIHETIKLFPDFIECFLLTPGGRAKINRCQPDDGSLSQVIQLFKESFTANNYRIYFCGNFLGFVKKGILGKKAMNQNTEEVYNQRISCLGLGPSSISQFPEMRYRAASDAKDYIDCLKNGLLPQHYGIFTNRDDLKRQYIISRIGYYRFIDKKAYHQLFGNHLINDFPEEINCLIAKRIISENKRCFIWHFDEYEMGHEEIFLHVLKYWYHPRYINQLLKKLT